MASGYPVGRSQSGRSHVAVQPCRSCAAPMLWVVTPGGKRNPLDLEPDTERGNVLVVEQEGEWRLGVVVHDPDVLAEVRQLFPANVHTSHFATCPNAEDHRRPKPRKDLE